MGNLVSEKIKQQSELVSKLKESDMYTYCLEVSSSCENHIVVDGKNCLNFISNNYLGFSTHPAVIEAVEKAVKKYGLGIGGSPMACGTTDIHIELMERIATVYQQDSALLFASGYQALLSSVQGTIAKGDVALLDSLVHRSIVDGVILSGADKRMWLHNDMEDLESLFQRLKEKYSRMLIIVDSVYSMDGDWANLPELYELKEKYGAMLLLDEAHSLGVLGENGYGLPEHFNMPQGADLIAGTFSKFAGAIGGFVTGPKEYIDHLRHVASPFIFSASLSPLICAGILKSFDLLDEEPQWRDKLWENVKFFHEGLKSLGFDIGVSKTAVVPLIVKDTLKTMLFNKKILDRGVYASPIVHPAVPPAESRIRLGVMATHTREDLEKCLEIFEDVGKELEII